MSEDSFRIQEDKIVHDALAAFGANIQPHSISMKPEVFAMLLGVKWEEFRSTPEEGQSPEQPSS